jgi:hypothetical protein
MELRSVTEAFEKIVKVLQRYVYFQDHFSYQTLALFVLQTYCFKKFDATPFIFLNGPSGSGKTLTLEILDFLCYRSLLVSSISDAGFYHAMNQLQGTLILDEAEYLSQRYQHVIDMATLLHGYKIGGFVARLNPGTKRLVKFNCFGPKIFANITGIFSRPLRSRCITIRTVFAEREMKRFSTILHGKLLKEFAKATSQLFKRKRIQDQVKSIHQNLLSEAGLSGRDLELWIGMLTLAKLIDSEESEMNLYDQVLKMAMATIQKREEEAFFDDWDVKLFFSAANYLSKIKYDGTFFLVAEKVFKYVFDDVKPPFPMRTEDFGRKLYKESLIDRKPIYYKDSRGKRIHKKGWKFFVDRINRRVSKYREFLEEAEEIRMDESKNFDEDPREKDWVDLTEEEMRKTLAEVGRPTNWRKRGNRRS